jgi:hypothetical protein
MPGNSRLWRELVGHGALLVALAGLAGPGALRAEIAAKEQAAIDHLLAYIEASSCEFERNGRRYDSDRAYSHVVRKYEYFIDEIETAEDFIELAATRSTRSGDPYHFECSGRSSESAKVLTEELSRYRAAAAAG